MTENAKTIYSEKVLAVEKLFVTTYMCCMKGTIIYATCVKCTFVKNLD